MVHKAVGYDNYGKYFPNNHKVVLVREQPGIKPINGSIASIHKDTICVEVRALPPVPDLKDNSALTYQIFTDFVGIEMKITAKLINFASANTMTFKFISALETGKPKPA
ncbi:MAG TPA: hypothetical protein PLN25_00010 [Deltaproteobacteria bacterium]|nr:hypothetical protein [Deltaproteobacteria bacterium]